MRILPFIFLLILTAGVPSFAQKDSEGYRSPLGIDLRLAGNFGELRSDHFHTGIDLKTWGQEGLPIRAIEKGQVSRIKVQEGGYGKALYIKHPDGNTSVYAHLKHFSAQIDSFLKEAQYEHERGPIQLYPGNGILPVNKGDTVARSGNSGSSTAPHLHFEIRNSSSERPIDPLLFDFDVFDRSAPEFHGLRLIWMDPEGREKEKVLSARKVANGEYRPSSGRSVRIGAPQDLRLAVRTTDQATGTQNPLGVQALKLFIDGELQYSARFDTLDFSKNAYINAHIDHPYLHEAARTYHRCKILPHNELAIYGPDRTSSFHPIAGSTHQARIEAYDRSGNRSVLRFQIRSSKKADKAAQDEASPKNSFACRWDVQEKYRSRGLELSFRPKTLYQDHRLHIESDSLIEEGDLSQKHRVHNASIPLHKPFEARIELDSLPQGMKEKLFILSSDKKWGTRAFKAEYEEGWAVGQVKRFGELSVRADSTSPEIRPIRTRDKIPKAGNESFRFHVGDNLSGIASYEAYVGCHWRIPYYDVKKQRIKVKVSDTLRPLPTGKTRFVLRVRDRAGNQGSFVKEIDVQ